MIKKIKNLGLFSDYTWDKKSIIVIILIAVIGAVSFVMYRNMSDSGSRTYKNEKFGYRVTLPQGWKVPVPANAQLDLTRKYLTVPVGKEIFDPGEIGDSADPMIVKDPQKLADVEEKIAREAQTWDPSTAQFVMFTDVSEEDQARFFEAVERKEKSFPPDFFPSRTIRVEPSEHVANLTKAPTNTSRKIEGTITLPNGLKAEYIKLIGPNIGATFVYVPLSMSGVTYDGKKINSLEFTYLGNEISESDFLSIVNSVALDR